MHVPGSAPTHGGTPEARVEHGHQACAGYHNGGGFEWPPSFVDCNSPLGICMGLTWTMGTTFGGRRSRTIAGIKLGYLEFVVQRVKVCG